MAFRNPTHTLPSSAIRGQIPGSQIDGPLNPGTVDGPAIVPGAVELPHLERAIMASLSQKWWDFGDSATRWQKQGTGAAVVTSVSTPDASAGVAMRVTGYAIMYRPDVLIPFDPRALYRVSYTLRQTVAGSVTADQRVFLGVAGVAADRTTFVNIDGNNTTSTQHQAAARAVNLSVSTAWQTFTGYVQGYGTTAGDPGPSPSLLTPLRVHPSVRYLTPEMFLNYANGTGTVEIDTVSIEVVPTGPVDGAVHIMPGTVIADRLSADAIDGKTVSAVVFNGGQINGAEINGVDIVGTSTVTGATIQTSAAGPRIVMTPAGTLQMHDGDAGHDPGLLESGTIDNGGIDSWLRLRAPAPAGNVAEFLMQVTATGRKTWELGPLTVRENPLPGTVNASVLGDAEVTGAAAVYGQLTAGNIRAGRVVVTSVANTPTPVTITGIGLTGTPRATLGVNTSAPGTVVKGASWTSLTNDAITIWLTRSDVVATTVDYTIIGV